MTAAHRILLRPHAKINIGLHVLHRRPDGYHDIETIFHEVNWHDEIELHRAEGISMECSSPAVPTDSENLCMKAAALLRQWSAYEHGVNIRLTKNIPVGGGLGGGSSDAAAVLVGLNELWNLALPPEELQRLAGQLGSDVSFFIQGGSAYATGRGEVLRHGNFRVPFWILLVTPPIHVSTAWAYSHAVPRPDMHSEGLAAVFEGDLGRSPDLLLQVENDFEIPVFAHYPAIRDVKQRLLDAGAALALMSGSGSSVFGLFREEEDANKAASQFSAEYLCSLTPPMFTPPHPRLRTLDDDPH